MEVGFFVAPYGGRPLGDVLAMLRKSHPALSAVEIGTTAYGEQVHCDPKGFLADRSLLRRFEETILKHGFRLSSLSAHGNLLHPDPEVSARAMARLTEAVNLMAELDMSLARSGSGEPVRVVNCFSGLPAADVRRESTGQFVQAGRVPGWNTAPWPDEHFDSFTLQLEYAASVWKGIVRQARDLGVELALELHPNMLVHNSATYLALLEGAEDDGSTLGLNFDPSHFFWRGIDPLALIRYLSRETRTQPIKHVHGKDTLVDRLNSEIQGTLSMVSYADEARRPWRFVTIGEGWDPVSGAHDLNWWQRFVTELQLWDYDHVISIEHEDSRKSFNEGLTKALRILDLAVNRESPGPMTWADR